MGDYGERVAAALPGRAGHDGARAQLALPRRARSTSSRVDGDCLVVCEVKTRRSVRVGHAARGGDAGEARPAAPARRGAGSPSHGGAIRRGPHRRRRRAVPAPRAARGRARAGGGLSGPRRRARVALVGLEGHVVEVEADMAPGLPAFTLVGLPDTALVEARDRVRAALGNAGRAARRRRITVNLSPGRAAQARHGLRPRHRGRACSRRRRCRRPGGVARRRCIWASSASTAGCGRSAACCPPCSPRSRAGQPAGGGAAEANAAEARLVPGARACVAGARSLRRRGGAAPRRAPPVDAAGPAPSAGAGRRRPADRRRRPPDLADVVGQAEARARARGRRRRRPPPVPARAAGRRQDDARRAAARPAAGPRRASRRSR